uniref:TSA: Wollemia nobilis Ref_Wollemi_Transcript_2233_1410 transcribed RNA sequence n=1 Tax=Wollemia nobilis TaxID=56998 RepID=A0A0C9RYV1_9CONI
MEKRKEMDEEERSYMVLLKSVGGELLEDGRNGVRIGGWRIESKKRPILKSHARDEWEKKLDTAHLPEMVFGESSLELVHEETGIKIYFNAFDALLGWKQEPLPPVEVPAAAKWKFRSKPSQQVILDYDYTFTTPYCGSEVLGPSGNQVEMELTTKATNQTLKWVACEDHINMVAVQSKDPILFYDEVVLYEDELADNGVSLLTVKVRVMPTCWFLLLRFWLRVDGVLMRVRDTRIYCAFESDVKRMPVVIRECTRREDTFKALAARGFSSDSSAYGDPNLISERLPITCQSREKLSF